MTTCPCYSGHLPIYLQLYPTIIWPINALDKNALDNSSAFNAGYSAMVVLLYFCCAHVWLCLLCWVLGQLHRK